MNSICEECKYLYTNKCDLDNCPDNCIDKVEVRPECHCLDFIEDKYKNNLINLIVDNLEFNVVMENGVPEIEISLYGKYIKTI